MIHSCSDCTVNLYQNVHKWNPSTGSRIMAVRLAAYLRESALEILEAVLDRGAWRGVMLPEMAGLRALPPPPPTPPPPSWLGLDPNLLGPGPLLHGAPSSDFSSLTSHGRILSPEMARWRALPPPSPPPWLDANLIGLEPLLHGLPSLDIFYLNDEPWSNSMTGEAGLRAVPPPPPPCWLKLDLNLLGRVLPSLLQ
jgi:hypothetical protein